MSATARRKTVYVVQRLGMQMSEYADFPAFYPSHEEEASFVLEQAFATRAEAEARCRELELQARRILPPVRFMPYELARPATQVASDLRAAGLKPPTFRRGSDALAIFRRWWAEHAPTITPEQNAALWDAFFPDWKLYTVTKLTLED
jgi:hypothetical protein